MPRIGPRTSRLRSSSSNRSFRGRARELREAWREMRTLRTVGHFATGRPELRPTDVGPKIHLIFLLYFSGCRCQPSDSAPCNFLTYVFLRLVAKLNDRSLGQRIKIFLVN